MAVRVHDFVIREQEIAFLARLDFVVQFNLGVDTARVGNGDFVSIAGAPERIVIIESGVGEISKVNRIDRVGSKRVFHAAAQRLDTRRGEGQNHVELHIRRVGLGINPFAVFYKQVIVALYLRPLITVSFRSTLGFLFPVVVNGCRGFCRKAAFQHIKGEDIPISVRSFKIGLFRIKIHRPQRSVPVVGVGEQVASVRDIGHLPVNGFGGADVIVYDCVVFVPFVDADFELDLGIHRP